MKLCPQHWKDTAGGFLNIVDCFLITSSSFSSLSTEVWVRLVSFGGFSPNPEDAVQ